MSENRNWMYQRLIDGFLNLEFVSGVEKYFKFACAHSEWMDGEKKSVSVGDPSVRIASFLIWR